MRKLLQTKNNKKAFSLPVAIIITSVLILLSSSLIIIAATSISNTSSDASGRQAYLNVRSALDYAYAYYNSSKSASTIDTQCIIIPEDSQSIAKGAVAGNIKVVDVASGETVADKVTGVTTYVVAKYLPADPATGLRARLKLTAYSNYSDAFGQKSKTAHLSVTYIIGADEEELNRVTVMELNNDHSYSTSNVGENNKSINLNVKKNPNQGFVLSYYTWTFQDVSNIYNDTNIETYNGAYNIPTSVATKDKMNVNEKTVNVREPNKPWATDGIGAPAIIGDTDNTNGNWLHDAFYPKSEYVDYFNIIFAKKGMNRNINNDAQTCEIFHLWYIDPSDKNIYFEFLRNDFSYWTGTAWNGTDNLEDTILAYTNNPKTTIHFKIKGVDNENVTPTISAPVINSITVDGNPLNGKSYFYGTSNKAVTNLSMQYEGCGWWVANVETKSRFAMQISYTANGRTKNETLSVSPSNGEAWVVATVDPINASNDTILYRTTETNANKAIGERIDSYVTVSARPYKKTSNVNTIKLSFKDNGLKNCEGRTNLLDKILEADALSWDDYADITALQQAYNEAVILYNNEDFIESQAGPTNSEKIHQATTGAGGYNEKITNLDNAIKALVPKVCDADTLDALRRILEEVEQIKTNQTNNGIYDNAYYQSFITCAAYTNAEAVKSALESNPSSVTTSNANQTVADLRAKIDELNTHKLDREPLHILLLQADSLVDDATYIESYRNDLRTVKTSCWTVYNNKSVTQSDLNTQCSNLQNAINRVLANRVSDTFNTAAYDAKMIEAKGYIEATEKLNCTEAGYQNLKSIYESNETDFNAATSQADVDALTDKISQAIDEYLIYKPDNTMDKLASQNIVRVWFNGFMTTGISPASQIIQYKEDSSETAVSLSALTTGAGGLQYLDVNKTVYNKIEVKIADAISGTEYSHTIDIGAENNIVCTATQNANGEFNFTVGKVTTYYIEKTVGNTPTVKLNNVVLALPTDSTNKYYEVRTVYNNANSDILSVTNSAGTEVQIIISAAGEYVLKFNADETALVSTKTDIIYPLYTAETTSPAVGTTSSSNGYTISNAISTELVSESILQNVMGTPEIITTATVGGYEDLDVTVETNKIVLYIKKSEFSSILGSSDTPYIYTWTGTGSSAVKQCGAWPGKAMIRSSKNSDYYYFQVENTTEKVIINNNNTKQTGDITIPAGNIFYKVSYAPEGNNTTSAAGSNFVPQVQVVTPPAPSNTLTGDLIMVMVGGEKVKFTNKSYAVTYGEGQRTDEFGNQIWNGNPFGGDNRGGASVGSTLGRVGDTSLSTIYDWYEFKIPVEKLDTYIMEIKGLDGKGTNTLTKQLQNVYGDIWIDMKSETKESNRYSDIDVYTFNPDDTFMDSNVTVYFKKPADSTTSTWGTPHITASGIDTSVDTNMTLSDENNYYCATVSKKTPFVSFTVVETTTDATGTSTNKTHTYRTSLQGGDNILFNPESNAGTGAWDNFVPIRIALSRAIQSAYETRSGNAIVSYNNDGTIKKDGENTYKFPEGIMEIEVLPGRNVWSFFSDSTYTVITSTVNALNTTDARTAYNNLNSALSLYKTLFSQMSKARSFIANPDDGGKYPEYLNRGNKRIYNSNSVNNLKTALSNAKSAYLSPSYNATSINNAIKGLKNTISNMTVDSEGSIPVVYVDIPADITNHIFQIQYKTSETAAIYTTQTVSDRNVDGYPIIFIEEPSIYDVDFLVDGVPTGIVKSNMNNNESWVYIAKNTKWVPNSSSDYKTSSSDEITQQNPSDEYTYKMPDDENKAMTVYFNIDTKVSLADGSSYTIRAGAYYFKDRNNVGADGTYPDPTSPIKDGKLNLFSANAKTYFSNEANYGKYAGAYEAADIGWVNSDGSLKTGNQISIFDVNFTAKSGSVLTPRSYTTTGKMYFRWENNDDLIVRNNVTLAATELTIGSAATIDASSAYGKHFYLSTTTINATEMKVIFKSDIKVKYVDTSGLSHSFTIREGEYTIRKVTDPTKAGYIASQSVIADLFDEQYWTSREYCEVKGRSQSFEWGVSNGSNYLNTPIYGNE